MAEGKYVKLEPKERVAMCNQNHVMVPAPKKVAHTLSPVEADNLGYLLDTSTYPWRAFTGNKERDPNDFSRTVFEEHIPVFTEVETTFRDTIIDTIVDLTKLCVYVGLANTKANEILDKTIKNLTESVMNNTHDRK